MTAVTSATSTTSRTGSTSSAVNNAELAGNFTEFLQLLTTKLQNQDPLSPLDPTQFTTQLAQFSEVEQAINTNTKLQSLIDAQSSGQMASSVSYLGKIIDAPGDKSALSQGSAHWSYNVASNAKEVAVAIVNSQGQVVRLLSGPTAQGVHQVVWDGTDDAGNTLPDGIYQLQVAARDQSGNPISVTTNSQTAVTGVSLQGGQVMLETASGPVALTNVASVRDPNASTN